VIVDCSRVADLDRAGLLALLRFIADLRAAGRDVALLALSGKARLQAQRMQLHRLVEVFNTVEEVTQALPLSRPDDVATGRMAWG
jgi:anti-anti-sigma regulatory factor